MIKQWDKHALLKNQGLGEGGLYFTYGFYSLYIIYIYLFELHVEVAPIVFYIEFLFPFDEGFMYSNVTPQEYFCLPLSIC